MPTKEQLINNLREYSAAEIVHAIKCGEISMYELSKSGKLTPLMRKRIEEQMVSPSEDVASVEESVAEPSVEPEDNEDPIVINGVEEEPPSTLVPAAAEIPAPPINYHNVSSQNPEGYGEILDNKGMFKRVFSFKGRIRRTEFGLSYIIFFVWYLIFMSVTEMNDVNPVLALFIILTIVPAYWFLWAQGAKRCHDRGNSGWYQIIPFYGFVMLFGGSDEGINEYGTNPKE